MRSLPVDSNPSPPRSKPTIIGRAPARPDRAPVAEWLDPLVCPPPKGSKIQLLTDWGIAVYGHWADDGYVAWAPLLQKPAWLYERLRQKRLEKEDLR